MSSNSTTKKRPKGKHTKIIDDVVNRLYNSTTNYQDILVEYEYKTRTGKVGECDIKATAYEGNKKYLLVFEIKSCYTKKNDAKTNIQLEKDKAYFNNLNHYDKTFMFKVFGDKKGYEIQWRKQR